MIRGVIRDPIAGLSIGNLARDAISAEGPVTPIPPAPPRILVPLAAMICRPRCKIFRLTAPGATMYSGRQAVRSWGWMSETTEQRLSSARWTRGEAIVALVGVVWVAVAAFWAVPGVLTIDGFVYQAMIDAFARNGSLFIGNGYEEYGSEALALPLSPIVDGRLAPQYPGGWGILAAPAYAAAGLRGVILVNALASALTLPLIWQAARALFDDRRLAVHAALIYGLATFAVDYAFGVWPHGIATFLVTAALAAVATGWRGPPAAELRGALVAGLAIGAGINLRVDAFFAVAPLAIWLLGAGRRPYASLALLLAGLVPGLLVAAAINHAKFGSFSPFAYGKSEGRVSLEYYAELALLTAVAGLAALVLGLPHVRAVAYRPRLLGLATVGVFAVLLAAPATRELLLRLAQGFWILVVDLQAHPLPALGMTVAEDGTIETFGVLKKALLQSLPYAAVVIILMPRLWRGPDRAALALCFLFVLLLMVPFAYSTWHGGAAKNMRYFLSSLPALAILSAAALREIGSMAQPRPRLAACAMLAVAGAALLFGALRGYGSDYVVEATLPNLIAGSIVALSILTLLARGEARGTSATVLGAVVGIGLLSAFASGWIFDLRQSQYQRGMNLEMAWLTQDLPAEALVVTDNPKFLALRVNRPPALTAQTDFYSGDVGPELVALVGRAFAEGRPVFAQGLSAAKQLVAKGASAGFSPRYGIVDVLEVYRMSPSGEATGASR